MSTHSFPKTEAARAIIDKALSLKNPKIDKIFNFNAVYDKGEVWLSYRGLEKLMKILNAGGTDK